MNVFRRFISTPVRFEMIYQSHEHRFVPNADMRLLTVLAVVFAGGCALGPRTRSSSQCGVPLSQGKIIGGTDSGGYRYPWFALLLLKKNSHIPVPVCAGSLISSIHVLTAAHCFTISASIQYDDLFTVALGVYDICNDAEGTRQTFNMADVAVHEKYRKNGKFYDIALIKLDRPADFVPICLPRLGVPDITESALLIGFGVTEENSNFTPCHMVEVNVTKYSKANCSASGLPSEEKQEPSVICAGTLTGAADSCYGDSGGPLQTFTPDGRYVIAGIVSYGYGCGVPNVPGVYTNVGSYIQWIDSKISLLGSKNQSDSVDHLRRGIFRRRNSSVTFPGSLPGEEEPRQKVHQLERKMPTFSAFPSRREDPANSRRSKVSFPE